MAVTRVSLTGTALGIALLCLGPGQAQAVMPSDPTSDKDFLILPDGRDLRKVKVSGSPLTLAHGAGKAFGEKQRLAYEKLKAQSMADPHHPVQWLLMDLDSHQVLGASAGSGKRLFGASASKPYVAATLLDKQNGYLSKDQLQIMANMLVISSNDAWTELQKQAGDGNADRGRAANYKFTQRMGYKETRGFQGSLGHMHGNELLPSESAEFLYDIYHAKFPGAEVLWKLMHTLRTGETRAKKYLPTYVHLGGKTGTYDGTTINPETGNSSNSDGTQYKVHVRNQLVVFNVNKHEYGLAILANTGADESAALLAGGLYRELLRARY